MKAKWKVGKINEEIGRKLGRKNNAISQNSSTSHHYNKAQCQSQSRRVRVSSPAEKIVRN
jgi:hypothetical protein